MKPNEFTTNEVRDRLNSMGCRFIVHFDPKNPNLGMTFDTYFYPDEGEVIQFIKDYADAHGMSVNAWTNCGGLLIVFQNAMQP